MRENIPWMYATGSMGREGGTVCTFYECMLEGNHKNCAHGGKGESSWQESGRCECTNRAKTYVEVDDGRRVGDSSQNPGQRSSTTEMKPCSWKIQRWNIDRRRRGISLDVEILQNTPVGV